MSDEELIPELGDRITILSQVFKSTTGRILYRDESLIRVRPDTRSTTAIDFPLDPESGLFLETLGVKEVQIHEKRRNPAFAAQLAVFPKDQIQAYDSQGAPTYTLTVEAIHANESQDAIVVRQNGQLEIMDFAFLGIKDLVLVPMGNPEELINEENQAADLLNAVEEEEALPELDDFFTTAGLSSVEADDNKLWDDISQRESMFLSLMKALPYKKQKDPRQMAKLYRQVDVFLALKNSIVVRDADQALILGETRSYVPHTLQDVAEKTTNPIAALLPVVNMNKILYADLMGNTAEGVLMKQDTEALLKQLEAASAYSNAVGTNAFAAYLQQILGSPYQAVKPEGRRISVDQDVIRSKVPPTAVKGYRMTDTPGYKPLRFGGKGAIESLSSFEITDIQTRSARLLAGSILMDTKTGVPFVVADADTAVTLAHVLLSQDLATQRSPTRSSVLLYDILNNQAIRRPLTFFDWRLRNEWNQQRVVNPGETIVLADVIRAQLRHKALRYSDNRIQSYCDSLGLRFLEWSPSVLNAVNLKDNQDAWLESMNTAKTKSDAARQDISQPVYGVLFPDSVLSTTTVPIASDDKDPLRITADLLQAAGCTALPLWIATAAKTEAVATLEASAKAEAKRLAFRETTRLETEAAFKSKPKINPCVHVVQLDQIRGVRDVKKRMDLLEDFVQKNGVGQHNQWILCGLCKLPLVCKHEKLLIEELRHPGRGTILHKTLLLDYASPHVFEGRYICKYCGQAIQRIDYDTSLEFDDDGIPLSGRAVMEDEPDDDDDLALITASESTMVYTGQQKTLYLIARTIFEGAGFSGNDEIYARTIKSATLYLEEKAPKEQAYITQRQKLIADGVASGKKVAVPPEYRKLICNLQIGVIGALCVLELQTAETEIPIPFPKATCPFSLNGFPLDGEDPTIGLGCVYYIGCVIASIYREDSPWGLTSWTSMSDVGKRRDAVAGEIRQAMLKVLGLPKLPNIAQVTDIYAERLKKKRDQRVGEGAAVVVLASKEDILPPSFRPLPFLKAAVADDPIQNVASFTANVKEKPFMTMAPYIKERETQLAHILVKEFHSESAKGTVLHPHKSEGICCNSPLQAVAKKGLGYKSLSLSEAMKKEIDVLHEGGLVVERKDLASGPYSSHIRVPWVAPVKITQIPALEPEDYYKLFMKKCYEGRRYGQSHEFGYDSKCRNCGFELPPQLAFLSLSEISDEKESMIAKKLEAQTVLRKQICLQAFVDQKVVLTDKTFLALEAAVKQHLSIPPVLREQPRSNLELLQNMATSLVEVLPTGMESEYAKLLKALNTIHEKKIPKGIARAKELSPFVASRDALVKALEQRMIAVGFDGKESEILVSLNRFSKEFRGEPLGSQGNPAKTASLLRDLRSELTDATEGAKLCQHFLVVLGQQALSHAYTVDGSANKLPLSKWFPSINRDHLEILRKIWIRSDSTVCPYIPYLWPALGPQEPLRKALHRFTQWLSGILSFFVHVLKPSEDILSEEASIILEWFVCAGMLSLLTPASPLYADIVNPAQRASAPILFLAFLQDVLDAGIFYALRFKRSPDEIAHVLRVREEVEKSVVMSRLKADDKSLHDVEVIKKQLKLGVWGQGRLENLVGYNEKVVGLQFSDIRAMGINDFGDHVVGPRGEANSVTAAPREGYENRVRQDEDEF